MAIFAGDTIFFAYAGHGTSVPGANLADEADGMNEALVPMDYATAGVISDDDLFTVSGWRNDPPPHDTLVGV